MNRTLQSLCLIIGGIFASVAQPLIWQLHNNDKLIPYLLTAIIFILIAIYLKKEGNQ